MSLSSPPPPQQQQRQPRHRTTSSTSHSSHSSHTATARRHNKSRSRSRSRSPIVAFSSASGDVQNITRKVIRRLEGLGHLEMVDIYAGAPSNPPLTEEDTDADVPSSSVSDGERPVGGEQEEGEEGQVERALMEELVRRTRNGHVNGNGISTVVNGGIVHIEKDVKNEKEKKTIDWEIPRKLLHSSIGFVTLYLYITETDVSKIVLILWSSLCIIVPADILRLRSPKFEKVYEKVLGFLMRESEKNSSNGVIWYILGVNFALQFYPRDVATMATLILSWADTAASTLGRFSTLYYPSSPLSSKLPSSIALPLGLKIPLAPRKSWAGFVAAGFTGLMIVVGFWSWIAPMRFAGREVSWAFQEGVRSTAGGTGMLTGWAGLGVIGVFAGLVSGVAEALDLGSLDDNLTLPIISGGCILGFLKFVGWIGSVWTSFASS